MMTCDRGVWVGMISSGFRPLVFLSLLVLVACSVQRAKPTMDSMATADVDPTLTVAKFIAQAEEGHPEAVQAMIAVGMDPNVRNDDGTTALQAAVGNWHLDTVRVLIAAKADVQVTDQNGATLLHYAASGPFGAVPGGNIPLMKMLVDAGVPVDRANEAGLTPLMWVAHGGEASATEFLLTKGANANWKRLSGVTPLMDAARGGKAQNVELLLAHGADVNAAIPDDGMTALMLAASRGAPDAVRALLRAKADVNARRVDGTTALTMALMEGHTEIVEMLRAAGAKE